MKTAYLTHEDYLKLKYILPDMNERVHIPGGKVSIESNTGSGSVIRANIPLDERS